jgi:16S rRNA C967 or C1407 C5-methylase (RsmB/RsmF family)
VHNIRVERIEPGPEALEQLKALHGACERVLVDAPCSGTGTFRRKPDARYRLEEKSLAEHVLRQKTLLERFSALVKPGGRLVALCANGPRQNASLRPMVQARGGEWEDLPADTFKEEGAGVRVALITMQV